MPAIDPAQYSDSLLSPKWIRGLVSGRFIVDSRRALLARRSGKPPVYYFPRTDIDMSALTESPAGPTGRQDGRTRYWDLAVAGRKVPHAAWEHIEALPNTPQLTDCIAFEWASMDAWFEEDEQVSVHPRDPGVRVDTLRSSRHIRILVDGETIAESHSPVLLFETGLPTRYYLPRTHVRQDLLIPSDHVTYCPYKGKAHYFSLSVNGRTLDNLLWYYRYPTHEASAVAGLICLYTERADAFHVDGELAEEPAQ